MTGSSTKHSSRFLSLRIRPWGLLEGGGYLVCAASLLGCLAGQAWFLDPLSHFRVQYAAGLSVLAALLLLSRRFKTATLFAGCGLLNLGLILPLYVNPPARPPGKDRPIRTMLANVNTQRGNASALLKIISRYAPDILVLEEISPKWVSDLNDLSPTYPYQVIEPREDNFGIGLYSRFPLVGTKTIILGESMVPSIWTEVNIGEKIIALLATHPLPPVGRDYTLARNRQLSEIPALLAPIPTPIIVIGDLNTTPWNPHFRKLLKETNLHDSSRGRGIQPTWPATTPLLRIPIDHVLHSPDLHVVHKEIGPGFGSDHLPVIVDFVVDGSEGV